MRKNKGRGSAYREPEFEEELDLDDEYKEEFAELVDMLEKNTK